MDRWLEIELFVQVAELGSLSQAAETLGISNPAASRYLSALEKRLGARLIKRTTRSLALSDVGQAYFESCKAVLAELRAAERAVSATVVEPTGLLRVTASLSFAVQHVAPLLPEYTRRHPGVRVHVDAANRYTDLIDNDIDVAFRTREYEADSSITIRRLAGTRRVLCATPGYLDRHGCPGAPEDLAQHEMLLYDYARQPDLLTFNKAGEERSVRVKGRLEANDGQVLRAAALAGMGILVQPKYIVYDDLVAGRLVAVLDEWDLPRLQINIAFQSRRHMSAKVRTFIDFIVEHFRVQEFDRKWSSFEIPLKRMDAS